MMQVTFTEYWIELLTEGSGGHQALILFYSVDYLWSLFLTAEWLKIAQKIRVDDLQINSQSSILPVRLTVLHQQIANL